MLDAFAIGATAMQAQQTSLEAIANNLANVNTAGFKKARVGFTDVMLRQAGAAAGGEEAAPQRAAGVALAMLGKSFEAGDLKTTGSAMDLAIRGDAFLEVTLADGSAAYVRGGTLKINPEGLLAEAGGRPFKPAIAIPSGADNLAIAADGMVHARLPGQAQPVELGRLDLVRFRSPGALAPQGDNLYRATEASGEALPLRPEEGAAALLQGHLETSNVKMVDEMVALMLAQRGYEAAVKVVQAADEMLGLANGLRR